MTLSEMRKAQKELTAQLESGEISKKEKREEDPNSWYPKLAEDGTSTSTIRFLPNGAAKPWVTEMKHVYQGKNGWLNELCPTMFGEKCPQCEDNSTHYEGKTIVGDPKVKDRIRKTKNYVNILVIDDKATPENNGKVFYFKFGNEILKIITDSAKRSDDEDVTPKRPFDVDDGHAFTLKTNRNSYKQIEYGQSRFKERSTPLASSDEAMEAILAKCHDLTVFVDKKNVKSWDALKDRMTVVAGATNVAASNATPAAREPAARSQPVPPDDGDQEVNEAYLRSFIDNPEPELA